MSDTLSQSQQTYLSTRCKQLSNPETALSSVSANASAAMLLIIAGSSLLLTACDLTDTNDPALSADQQNNPHALCQQQQQPFIYSVCQVKQSQLSSINTDSDDPHVDSNVDKSANTNDAKINDTNIHDTKFALKLFWKANDDNRNQSRKPLYTFAALVQNLPQQQQLKFAANAGMYNTDFAPIGYTVMQGQQIRSLNLKEGAGNFHLLPNGVLWWDKVGSVHITESQKMAQLLDTGQAVPWYATQSGPMLVIEGKIHPKFDKNSQSAKFRNGVGVCQDGNIRFVNSDVPVTFYQFASLFKEQLHCDNALFLDGGIASALYAPDIGQKDNKNMGVMVGLIEQQNTLP